AKDGAVAGRDLLGDQSLGITQATYSKYEFRSYMPHDLLRRFCLACGISLGSGLSGTCNLFLPAATCSPLTPDIALRLPVRSSVACGSMSPIPTTIVGSEKPRCHYRSVAWTFSNREIGLTCLPLLICWLVDQRGHINTDRSTER